MLAVTMRIFITVVGLISVVGVMIAMWLMLRGPSPVQAARIAAVLQSTAPPGEPPAYAHCASCHLHDGSGRPDGSIPRLTAQRRSVLENKLHRLRAGSMRMPVMEPYARTLSPKDITEIATYLSALPEPAVAPSVVSEEKLAKGASLFAQHCASCHGANGEGQDGLFSSRLCGQYAGYLNRRLDEVAARTRGDADAVMHGVADTVPVDDLRVIVGWLAAGKGCTAP